MRRLVLVPLLVAAGASAVPRAHGSSGSSQTSQQTQLIAQGARPAAMGEAYTAVADDSQAIYYNAAGLVQLANSHFALQYAKWFASTSIGSGAYATPLGAGTLGVGLRAFQSTDDVRVAGTGATGGQFKDLDALVDLAYAQPFGRNLALGGNVRFGYEKLERASGFGAGVDLSALYRVSPALNVGAAFLNAGSPMKLEGDSYLPPMTVRVGTAYRREGEEKRGGTNVLTLAADADAQVLDRRFALRLGFEYMLSLGDYSVAGRAGYRLGATDLGALADRKSVV